MNVLASTDVASVLPLLAVLACPLMMIFMMRGMHGGHGEHSHGKDGGCCGDGRDKDAKPAEMESPGRDSNS